MSIPNSYDLLVRRVRATMESETDALVEAGRVEVRFDVGPNEDHVLRPRNPEASPVEVAIQQESELSLFVAAPGSSRTVTIDIWDTDTDALIARLGQYLEAILGGRIELTLVKGSSRGRCRLWLSDGTCQSHQYNVWLGFMVGRGARWETFHPAPYLLRGRAARFGCRNEACCFDWGCR